MPSRTVLWVTDLEWEHDSFERFPDLKYSLALTLRESTALSIIGNCVSAVNFTQWNQMIGPHELTGSSYTNAVKLEICITSEATQDRPLLAFGSIPLTMGSGGSGGSAAYAGDDVRLTDQEIVLYTERSQKRPIGTLTCTVTSRVLRRQTVLHKTLTGSSVAAVRAEVQAWLSLAIDEISVVAMEPVMQQAGKGKREFAATVWYKFTQEMMSIVPAQSWSKSAGAPILLVSPPSSPKVSRRTALSASLSSVAMRRGSSRAVPPPTSTSTSTSTATANNNNSNSNPLVINNNNPLVNNNHQRNAQPQPGGPDSAAAAAAAAAGGGAPKERICYQCKTAGTGTGARVTVASGEVRWMCKQCTLDQLNAQPGNVAVKITQKNSNPATAAAASTGTGSANVITSSAPSPPAVPRHGPARATRKPPGPPARRTVGASSGSPTPPPPRRMHLQPQPPAPQTAGAAATHAVVVRKVSSEYADIDFDSLPTNLTSTDKKKVPPAPRPSGGRGGGGGGGRGGVHPHPHPPPPKPPVTRPGYNNIPSFKRTDSGKQTAMSSGATTSAGGAGALKQRPNGPPPPRSRAVGHGPSSSSSLLWTHRPLLGGEEEGDEEKEEKEDEGGSNGEQLHLFTLLIDRLWADGGAFLTDDTVFLIPPFERALADGGSDADLREPLTRLHRHWLAGETAAFAQLISEADDAAVVCAALQLFVQATWTWPQSVGVDLFAFYTVCQATAGRLDGELIQFVREQLQRLPPAHWTVLHKTMGALQFIAEKNDGANMSTTLAAEFTPCFMLPPPPPPPRPTRTPTNLASRSARASVDTYLSDGSGDDEHMHSSAAADGAADGSNSVIEEDRANRTHYFLQQFIESYDDIFEI